MAKKSFEIIISALEKEGYSSKIVQVNSKTKNLDKNSEQNNNNFIKPNIVYESKQSLQPIVDENYVGSINLTKLPILFGIEIPIVVVNYEYTVNNEIYYSSFGPFLIVINNKRKITNNEYEIESRFAVLNKPFFNFLTPLIIRIIKKNNNVFKST
tara:strand:+ start:387 stop:851 length:465 start_codon:yes stop_codon:yes gene_type:complete